MLSSFTGLLELRGVLAGALIAFTWSYACLSLAGYLKGRWAVRTGYTRKIFHLLIFISAVVAHALGGFSGVCIFGAMVSIVVGHAIVLGPDSSRYTALARELFDHVGNGRIKIEINQHYALADASAAHRDLQSRRTTGSSIFVI